MVWRANVIFFGLLATARTSNDNLDQPFMADIRGLSEMEAQLTLSIIMIPSFTRSKIGCPTQNVIWLTRSLSNLKFFCNDNYCIDFFTCAKDSVRE